MAIITLAFGNETWTLKQRNWNRNQVAEIKFLISIKGCSRFDKIRNKAIREDLKLDNTTGNKNKQNTAKPMNHIK